jgi:dihydrofolate synthase / folylpolyglutamate synthase
MARQLQARLDRLYGRRQFAIKLGLETMRRFCGALGDPQHAYAVVHVAGTNGKGSVCAMLSAILRGMGLRVGLYTSPHLVRFAERIQVDGRPLGDDALLSLMDALDAAAGEAGLTGESEPTFFEYTTALAFEHFRRVGVNVAVVEVGLGGRLDATNLVNPLVSVITRIGLDHMVYLGTDLASVAREKCGIVKPGRPVIAAIQADVAMDTIRAACAANGCVLHAVATDIAVSSRAQTLDGQTVRYETADGLAGTARLPLPGRHQLENMATAVLAAETMAGMLGMELSPRTVKEGLSRTCWPARLQVLRREPLLILDAAHNEDGAQALVRALDKLVASPVGFVVGMCGDKDVARVMAILGAAATRLWVTPLDNPRGADPALLAAASRMGERALVCESLAAALAQADAWAAREGGAVCVAGSIFLAGEVLDRLRCNPFDA